MAHLPVFLAAALSAGGAPAGAKPPGPATRNVAIVLYEGVELLDFAGPGEVFAAAGSQGAVRGVPAMRVYTVAASKAPIVSQGFVRVVPEFSVDDAPRPDLVVIPGGASGQLTGDPRFMRWLEANADGAITLTVCTGAFAAWKAGLLDGLTATTHHGSIARLREVAARTTVTEGRRLVDNGKVVTTAGVSAGIDGALHVVARLLGRAVADRTARYMEYAWSPEATLAGQYVYLNPSLDDRERAHQQAQLLLEEGSWAAAARDYRTLAAGDAGDGFAWLGLATALGGARDDAAALAAARKAAAVEATRADGDFTAACLLARGGRRSEALEAVERAAAAGFRAWWRLERDPDLASVRDDPRFKAVLAKVKPAPVS
jgi:transcriptional regulator GlxA family with amidase domain